MKRGIFSEVTVKSSGVTHDLSAQPDDELRRTRRELEASLALARPGSVVSVPIMAHTCAIDVALAQAPRSP